MPEQHKELSEYTHKRDFDKTPEPQGETTAETVEGFHFVVQHHIARRDHYDFRLELDHVLKSWAVPKGPSLNPHDKRLAIQVEDHPLEYRNFEGTIPQGEYGGGTVMIWDEGYWEPLENAEQGIKSGALKLMLYGERLKGRWAIIRMKPRKGERSTNWLLIKERDEYVSDVEASSFITSVRSGRTMQEIREEKPSTTKEEAHLYSDVIDEQQPKKAPKLSKTYPGKLFLQGIEISHPDKILYPETGLLKGEIAEYYSEIAERMMPFLKKRLLSVVRCPEGIDGSCFFKKHPRSTHKGVNTFNISDEDDAAAEYFYIETAQGLLSEVHMNTIEFHIWGSKIDALEQPDLMVFDLDPDVGMGISQIRQGVRDAKSLLDSLSLTSFLKTSGGKGYHIVVPFKPKVSWDTFRGFAKNVAQLMEAKWPERYTSNSRKSARQGRVYVDWQRNIRGATSVAPYSLRKREGAPVSMPIAWEELDTILPQDITLTESLERLNFRDPWEGFFSIEQELKKI